MGRRSRGRLRAVATGAALLVGAGSAGTTLAGCAGSASPARTTASVAASNPSATATSAADGPGGAGAAAATGSTTTARTLPARSAPSSSKPPVAPSVAVRRIALTTADLHVRGMPAGTVIREIVGGGSVSRRPDDSTLNNCGFRFASETHRVARRQIVLEVAGQFTGISNEVVAYDTPEQAATAMSEWRASVTSCRRTVFFPPIVAGGRSLRYDKETLLPQATMPVPDYAYLLVDNTDRATGRRFQTVQLLMHHGRYLDIVWTSSLAKRLTTVSTVQRTETLAIALATGRRMAAL